MTILDQDTVVVYHTVYKWNIHTDDRMYITSVFLSHVYTASILSLSENLIHFEKKIKGTIGQIIFRVRDSAVLSTWKGIMINIQINVKS